MKADAEREIALKIDQLKEQLVDIIETDEKFNDEFYLHRWLIAKQNSVSRTEAAIRESVIWRKENQIEALACKPWDPEVLKDLPIYMDHHTKTGQPVVRIDCDKIDLRALLKKYGKDYSFRFLNEMYAKFERLMIQHHQFHKKRVTIDVYDPQGKHIIVSEPAAPSPIIIIATFKDFSLWNAKSLDVIHLFIEGSKLGIKYFPCMATDIYLVNNNKISAMLFKMVRPVIAAMPYNIECYDTDQSKWSPELLQILQQYPSTHEFYQR